MVVGFHTAQGGDDGGAGQSHQERPLFPGVHCDCVSAPSQKFTEEDGGSAGRLSPEATRAAVMTGLTCISTVVLFGVSTFFSGECNNGRR